MCVEPTKIGSSDDIAQSVNISTSQIEKKDCQPIGGPVRAHTYKIDYVHLYVSV